MKKILSSLVLSSMVLSSIGTLPMKAFATEVCTPNTQTIVSSVGDSTDNGPAVALATEHGSWYPSASLGDGATWIWHESVISDPASEHTDVFTKTINVPGNFTSAEIQIAADNGYIIKVNDAEVVNKIDEEHNYGSLSTHALTFDSGDNTLEITVKNFAVEGAEVGTNPAGLLYKLVVNSEVCPTFKIHIKKYIDGVPANAENANNYAFGMSASWTSPDNNGSENFVLGPSGPGGTFHSTGGAYEANTPEIGFPATYTIDEVTTNDNPDSKVLPADAACKPGMYKLVGYKGSHVSFEDAASKNIFDPHTFHPENTTLHDRYLIIWNEKCPDVQAPEIILSKTGVYDATHQKITYTINWEVVGGNVDDLVITDTLPGWVDGIVTSISPAPTPVIPHKGLNFKQDDPNANRQITWDLGNKDEGSKGSITFVVEVLHDDVCEVSPNKVVATAQDGDTAISEEAFSDAVTVQDDHCEEVPPATGHIKVNKVTNPAGDSTVFHFNTTGTGYASFDLADLSAPNDQTLNAGVYSVAEAAVDGWTQTSVSCVNTKSDSSVNPLEMNLQAGETIECTFTNTLDEGGSEVTPPTITSTGGGGGGGGRRVSAPQTGSVLGAETSCGIYLDKYLKMGRKNDVESVKKVQRFLNDYFKVNIKVDGKFGPTTDKYVRMFQADRKDKVLTPWNLSGPTGIVYLTTTTEINNIMCPTLNLPIPANLIPIESNPEFPQS